MRLNITWERLMLKGSMTCILHTVSCAGLNRVMGRSTTMILLLAVLAATPRELNPAVQDPPPDPLPAILKTVAESSRVASQIRFDPRILARSEERRVGQERGREGGRARAEQH